MRVKMTIVLLTAIVVGCSSPDKDPDVYATGTDASNSELRSDALIGDMTSASAEGAEEAASTTATAAQVAQAAEVQQQQQAAHSGSSSTATSSAPAATEEEKKKMSNTTKGILIGAGAGIITGAAVSKDNRAKGAVIGGVIGAATGGAAGAVIDNRKKKK